LQWVYNALNQTASNGIKHGVPTIDINGVVMGYITHMIKRRLNGLEMRIHERGCNGFITR
jgi:hypothetical protein